VCLESTRVCVASDVDVYAPLVRIAHKRRPGEGSPLRAVAPQDGDGISFAVRHVDRGRSADRGVD